MTNRTPPREKRRARCEAGRGPYRQLPPAVLDVGCGPVAFDLELTTPDRYAGVDSSQPMLNMLVRKHPNVAAVYPMTIERGHRRPLVHAWPVRDRHGLRER